MRRHPLHRWLVAGVALSLLAFGGSVLAAPDSKPEGEGEFRILPYGPGEAVDDGRPGVPGFPPDDPFGGVQAVEEYARAHLADTFGGLYLEGAGPGDAGTLVVTFTAVPADHELQALVDLAGGVPIEFRTVDYALADLIEKQGEITEALADLQEQGVDIVAVGVDVMANRVQVTVTGSADHAAATLGRLFGTEMLQVDQGEPVSPLEPAVVDDAAGDSPGPTSGDPADEAAGTAPRPGFWQRLLDAIRSWWRAIFD